MQGFDIFSSPTEVRYSPGSKVLWVNTPEKNVVRVKLPAHAIVDFNKEVHKFDIIASEITSDQTDHFLHDILHQITKEIELVNSQIAQCKVVHRITEDPVHTERECIDMVGMYIKVFSARKEHLARRKALNDVMEILTNVRKDMDGKTS